MRRLSLLIAYFAMIATWAPVPASAWDTRVITCEEDDKSCAPWLSIYRGGASGSIAEHTRISDLALQQLGLRDLFGKQGSAKLEITDLNVSWLRRDHFEGALAFGDDPNGETLLEERRIPAPANFTGVPDYSYSVLDWLNKNSYCPPFASESYTDGCHKFVGWLGGFNSPHFGSQATAMYKRYHALALDMAGRAQRLRARLGRGPEKDVHEDIVKEMEIEALAFEGFAQHFLQDRWAMGHMWERWGAGDAAQMGIAASKIRMGHLLGIGAAAGLLHGSEAVINDQRGIVETIDRVTGVRRFLDAADPMSSPVIRDGVVVPMEWRHAGEGASGDNNPGVGDERFNDLYLEQLTGSGQFGSGYGGIVQRSEDLKFSAARQFNEMMTCSKAGWAEVVRAFGQHPEGGYGAHRAPLSGSAPSFAINDQASCWDMWATNEAMYTGLMDDGNLPIKYLALLGGSSALGMVVGRTGLVTMAGKMWIKKFGDPKGTGLATGEIGELADISTADKYSLPKYALPARVEDLVEEEPVGIDRQTLYGAFNRAHSDYWCDNLEDKLAPLRGSDKEHEQQVCRYLADFAYQGTGETYRGQQARERLFEGRPVRSICAVQGMEETEERDSLPFTLKPGYVPRETAEPVENAYTTPEVENWCDMVPVLDLDPTEEVANEDVIVTIEPGQTDVYLRGSNLVGPRWVEQPTEEIHGSLTIYNEDELALVDIISFHKWTDTAIHFDLPDSFGVDWRTGDFRVEVKRRDGKDSVGRFFLRISTEPPEIARVKALQADEVYYDTEENIFRPIPEGDVNVEVTFKSDMKTDNETDPASFLLGEVKIDGTWSDSRTWKGTVSHDVKGSELRALSIKAETQAGGWSDGDEEQDGNQPDTTYRLLLGSPPPYLTSLTAMADGDQVYAAAWTGGVDLSKVDNVRDEMLHDVRRDFDLGTAEAVPSSGSLTLILKFSAPLTEAPAVSISGTSGTVTGAEEEWQASFDLGTFGGASDLPVAVTLSSANVLGLDGSPRTVPVFDSDEGNWQRYEERRGGRDTRTGGTDTWHILGEPPSVSFAIVLDASGSMDDEDGRMESAKQGIYNALDGLDDGVEVAVLVFNGCGTASTVGFTRDLELVKQFVAAVSPGGDTALASTISQARAYLIAASHPASPEWRAAEFTDGEETCEGDVAGELYRLNAAILAHNQNAPVATGVNEEILEDLEAEAAEIEEPSIVCQPNDWENFQVEVESGTTTLQRIRLYERHFTEEELPDGSCRLRLKVDTYGVYYGSGRGWGINSRPSDTDRARASSSDGQGAVDALRTRASSFENDGYEMYRAERDIVEAVNRNLGNE
jgi:von Willebrand factor type A domain